jgi:isopenicillin N synthase-like dioxygenase
MTTNKPDKTSGTQASSSEFSRYDQVDKPQYHLAEVADTPDDFDEEFEFATLDMTRCLKGNAEDRSRFAQELGTAMEEIGFVILVGHGVDQALHDEADERVAELFTSGMSEKMRYRATRHGSVSEGYFPIKETSDIHPDLVEGWVFGRRAFDLDDAPSFDAGAFWSKPELEPFFRRVVQAELPLFLPIMQSILSYLGCDPHSFDQRLTKPNLGKRLNYYPALDEADRASGAGRLLGHEDIDLFTLLPAPAIEGLQVLSKAGKWIRLNAPRGSIVLNTGDYMQRLSNDLLPSTTHRVSPPRDNDGARVSLPLAAYLRPDEMLEVLPGLANPKYEPISVLTFHTRTTAKFYGDDYAVES